MSANKYVRLSAGLFVLMICVGGFIPDISASIVDFVKNRLARRDLNELECYKQLWALSSLGIYVALILILSFFKSTKRFITICFIALFPLLTIHNDFLNYTYLSYHNPENSKPVIETSLELGKGHYLINVDYTPASNGDSLKVYGSQKWKYGGTSAHEYVTVYLPPNKTSTVSAIDIPDDIIYVAFRPSGNKSASFIHKINVQSTHFCYYDSFILSVLSAILVMLFLKAFDDRKNRDVAVGLLVLTVISSIHLFSDFIYSGVDLNFHLMRIDNLKDSILSGHFPVRMSYEIQGGAGNAVPIMYPELFLYLPAVLRIAGASTLVSFKVFCFLGNLLCVLIAYFSMKRMCCSKYLGLIFSAMYTLCIWRLTSIYIRCAIGESLAMISIPLVMLGIYEIFHKDARKWYYLVIGITGIVQSHVISTFLIGIFIGAYILSNIRKIDSVRSVSLLKVALLTFCLNAWFVIPFLSFMPVAVMPYFNFLSISSLYINQMFSTFAQKDDYTFGIFKMGETQSEIPLTLGGIVFIGILMFICVLLFSKKNYFTGLKQIGKPALAYGTFALFVTSIYFPLYAMPVFKNIQFAWRFLTIASPLLCMVGSFGLYMILRKTSLKKQAVTLLIILACIIGSTYQIDGYLQLPAAFNNKYEMSYQSKSLNTDYTCIGSDPEYTSLHANTIVPSGEHVKITNYKRHLDRVSASYEVQELPSAGNYIDFPLHNFRGYKAEFNGDERIPLKIENGTNNFIRIPLPNDKKNGTITVHHAADDWVFISGNIITCITVLILLFFKLKILLMR